MRLLELLRQDKFDDVLEYLLELADKKGDSRLEEDIIFYSGRYNRLVRDQKRGTVSHDFVSVQMSRIREALIDIVKDIPVEVQNHNENPSMNTIITMLEEILRYQKVAEKEETWKETESLIEDFKRYQTKKRTDGTFDLRGDRKKELNEQAALIKEKHEKELDEETYSIKEQVLKMLPKSAIIASESTNEEFWTKIKKAYELAFSETGRSNRLIESYISTQPDSKRSRAETLLWMKDSLL